MALTIRLPVAEGAPLAPYALRGTPPAHSARLPFNRIAYSAAHVVANPLAAHDPWVQAALDWDATLAYRHHLWDLGLGVAESMDTAQRGMGLDWPTSLALIERTLQDARHVPGAQVACGCGTDHLDPQAATSIDEVIAAYETQMEAIERLDGRIILMASRALARLAKSPDDYVRVYGRLLSQARQPVILHWLGDMFDPALAGYWGTRDLDAAMQTAVTVIGEHADKVDGIKISLLDAQREIAMRRALPTRGGNDGKGVRMYTGDDFNYAELIAGDGHGAHDRHGQSDALLGIFDAIAPVASAALGELAQGNTARFHDLLGPTVPLSRHIFQAPTRFYKTGIVFMAWLNGHQRHFAMVGGQQSARSLLHLAELFRLADQANLLAKPELAVQRMQALLAVHGVD